jgi:hypothetical protein
MSVDCVVIAPTRVLCGECMKPLAVELPMQSGAKPIYAIGTCWQPGCTVYGKRLVFRLCVEAVIPDDVDSG